METTAGRNPTKKTPLFRPWQLMILGIILPLVLSGGAYSLKLYANSEYVQIVENDERWQQYLEQTKQASTEAERRKLQYQVDELEWKKERQQLSDKESWQLKRLKSELGELHKH